MPRMILNLFENLKLSALSYSVRVSYLEIFHDELIDLLQSNDTTGSQLKIYESNKNQIVVNGLTEINVTTPMAAFSALQNGLDRLKNHAHSAKSHTIFTLNVQLKEKPKNCEIDDDLLKSSKLCFVHLTSSENTGTKSRTKTIQSLASFNRVVQALIDKQSHIPYRDSKLTRIMHESLGGNAKTSVIATISPGSNAIEETLQTVELMSRIKCVVNHPHVNERLTKQVKLNDYATEISQLKRDIDANRNKQGVLMTVEDYENRRAELDVTRNDLRRHRFELESLTAQYEDLSSNYTDSDSNLCVLSKKIALLHEMKSVQDAQLKTISIINNQRDELIDRHSATEEKLTKQSNELMETIEIASDDASKLCDSNERRKNTDFDLITARDMFVSEVQVQLKNMSNYMVNNAKVFQNMIAVHKNNQGK